MLRLEMRTRSPRPRRCQAGPDTDTASGAALPAGRDPGRRGSGTRPRLESYRCASSREPPHRQAFARQMQAGVRVKSCTRTLTAAFSQRPGREPGPRPSTGTTWAGAPSSEMEQPSSHTTPG